MKQTLALMMAVAVLATTTMTSLAATTINYPVSGISSQAYVLDDDDKMYLTSTYAVDKVNYGETAYFPLLSSNSSAISDAKTAWENAKTAKTTADNAYTAALTSYNTANEALKAYNDAKSALDEYNTEFTPLNNDLTTAKNDLPGLIAAKEAAIKVRDEEAWKKTMDSGSWDDQAKQAQKDVDDTAEALAKKNAAIESIEAEIKALGSLSTLTSTEQAKLALLLSVTGNTASLTAAQAVVTDRAKALETATTNQKSAAEKVETTDTTYKNAQTNAYTFVYEPDAIDNVKITKKWEESGTYASSVEVVKKRVQSTIKGATTSSMQSIYFLAIKIKSGSSTQDRDLLGKVTLKKSGTNGYEVTTDITLELGYSSASDSDGEIPKTPKTFKEGSGFDAESNYVFTFAADSDSRFEVSTVGQGSIVLGFDTEYDEDIEDDYPDAILEFFNGNYASFNRTGRLYLGTTNDDGYVYEISKTGVLTRISPDYDDSEDAYVITTRTLGRYVISDTKLKITSSSSSSSSSTGSGSGSGTGSGVGGTGTTVVSGTSSTPSYTYTSPAATSSAAPPPASSSSKPEESESESEESESEPEELEDEDDIVDVVVDDEEAEGPEEKSGIATWVWALIIVGLAAVPVTIGVVYYLHNRPLRRDFFKNDEEGFDVDDDDED
ncbi:MAG TPA: hypothetical protein VN626_10690 [Clostridia bacterium]|nr:hypothetical protein [Clostridia bacterium]